jgi:hypothetical protein
MNIRKHAVSIDTQRLVAELDGQESAICQIFGGRNPLAISVAKAIKRLLLLDSYTHEVTCYALWQNDMLVGLYARYSLAHDEALLLMKRHKGEWHSVRLDRWAQHKSSDGSRIARLEIEKLQVLGGQGDLTAYEVEVGR